MSTLPDSTPSATSPSTLSVISAAPYPPASDSTTSIMTVTNHPWWKSATVYQIYPASFKDSNGDGIGDLNGILSKLDYVKSIGVDAIWICPMYDSPQIDMGYDISDYENVYPPYGTVADMEQLISACHERGLRVLLDLVINHTSHLHKWFQESRSSKTNPKRDWYIWRPAKYDADGNRKPPNNWRSHFGGSVWQWDEHTQEYYLHLFCPEQPDFNWDNEEARKTLYESSMRFWLDKGVDGFRVDTVNMYSKDPAFVDAPVSDPTSEFQFAANLFCNGPRMHEFLGEMNSILSEYDAMTVGELPHTKSLEKVLKYVSAKARQLSMTFQFDVMDVGMGRDQKYDTDVRAWTLPAFKDAVGSTQELVNGTDAWTTAFLENHDNARSISRFGSDATEESRSRSGKLLAMLLGSLSGTLFIYQGQEIGMVNAPKSWEIEEEYQDVESQNYLRHVVGKTENDAAEVSRAKAALQHLARDHARVPMQWDDSANAGFTTSKKPWMRTIDNYHDVNVKNQASDKSSVLSFWRQMLQLRKSHEDVFVHGNFKIVDRENEHTFVYEKKFGSQIALVALNFSDVEQRFEAPHVFQDGEASRILCNYADEARGESLRPFEGRIYLGTAARRNA